MSELDDVLKDYRDNERDIQMAQLAIEGHWSSVSYPKGVLEECLRLRPAIIRRITELGGAVPVSELAALTAKLQQTHEALQTLYRAAKMRRDWDVLGEEEFNEAYPDDDGWAHGDVDEEFLRGMEAAEKALKDQP